MDPEKEIIRKYVNKLLNECDGDPTQLLMIIKEGIELEKYKDE